LDFIIVLNPNSGPGAPPWWPNADYIREIPKLNAQPNVQTLGYVATTYCKRPISEVVSDIASYANWVADPQLLGLWVNGIFFDETPNVFSEAAQGYLETITSAVKAQSGIMGAKLVSPASLYSTSVVARILTVAQVVHNPGSAPDARLAQPGPDVTTVFEQSYANFRTAEHQQWLSTSPYDRERSSYMVHSVPEEDIETFVYELRGRAKHLFVTDLETDYYHSFGKSWNRFVAALVSD
jgi:hypothetical protein